jgi:hypothetical protein
MTRQAAQTAWVFTGILRETDEVSGTLTVHRGTGRWAQLLNTATGERGKGVYAYDATWKSADGRQELATWLTRNALLRLRRSVKREQASARQAGEP